MAYIQSSLTKPDEQFELPLRPESLVDFIGQPMVVARLQVMLQAAQERKEPLAHCLFSGPPGLGKTTLACMLAKAMGSQVVMTSGPILERPADLAGLLTNLKRADVLFIDEMHRLDKRVEEYLYSAMDNFSLDVMLDSGPHARSVQVSLEPFTLAAATTRSGMLSAPLRSRFVCNFRLDYYDIDTLQQIALRTAALLKIEVTKGAARQIAQRGRGTPRVVNNLLRWVRDFAQVRRQTSIEEKLAIDALSMLAIDHKGLDELDKRLLRILIEHHRGGPVGLQTLAAALGEEAGTLEEVHEPYLILQGLLERTPRGRKATALAFEHLA